MITRQKALDLLKTLDQAYLDAFAIVTETADCQGNYNYIEGEGSIWEDSVQGTLSNLASEIKNLNKDISPPSGIGFTKGI